MLRRALENGRPRRHRAGIKVDYFEPSNRVTLLRVVEKSDGFDGVDDGWLWQVAVPSLIRNMDPEALEEFKKEMGKGNVFQQMAAANKAMDASVEKQVNSKFGAKEEKNSGGEWRVVCKEIVVVIVLHQTKTIFSKRAHIYAYPILAIYYFAAASSSNMDCICFVF